MSNEFDAMVEVFALILDGGESNLAEASDLIRKLGPEDRRDLRAGLQQLDYLLDDVFLSEQRAKRIERQK